MFFPFFAGENTKSYTYIHTYVYIPSGYKKDMPWWGRRTVYESKG